MAERKDIVELARVMLERAHVRLESAELLLNAGKYDDSISRSYYAVFLAAKAILLLLGEEPKTRGGLMNIFGLKVVRKGLVNSEYGKILSSLFEAHQNSDYQVFTWFDKSDAEKYFEMARQFVKKMEELHQTLVSES